MSARRSAIAERLVELLPLFAAFNVHAVAHRRQLLALPLEAFLGWVVLKGATARHTSARAIGAGAALAAVALVLQLAGALPETRPGPVPPLLLGPLSAWLLGSAAFCALSRNSLYAWIYAWMLAALSTHVPLDARLLALLVMLFAATLAAAYAQGRLPLQGAFGRAAFAVFAALVAAGTFGLVEVARASEGMLMDTLGRLGRDLDLRAGVGLEDQIALRPHATVPRSMRLLFEVKGAIPARLRTTALDEFDGRNWTHSPDAAADPRRPVPAAPEVRTGLLFFEDLAPFLPAPAGTRAAEGAAAAPGHAGLWSAKSVRGAKPGLLRSPREELPAGPAPSAAATALPPELRAALVPLVASLRGPARAPGELAARLEAHFRDHYVYSLTTDLIGARGKHPLVVLIEERRPAYCVWFASAMAALLRAADVPARVIGGFVPGETDPLTGAALVRERDAHAWVEAYLPGRGWTAFDPTPWQSREDALGIDPHPSRLAALWTALGAGLRRVLAAPQVLLELVRSPILLLALFALLGWRLWRGRGARQRSSGGAALRTADPALRASYDRYLRALRRSADLVPRPAETDDELLHRLQLARGAEATAAAHEFLKAYRSARYRSSPAAIDLEDALIGLERTLTRNCKI